MAKKKKNKKKKKTERVLVPFNTGQRRHKSKKDYKRKKRVEVDDE